MKKAIITGATGAIGTALTAELVSRGYSVLVLTRKDSSRNTVIMKHPQVSVQYCAMDEYAAYEAPAAENYDVMFHLAWAGASGSGRNDMYLQNANVRYALDAVGLAKRLGCSRFVGIGSQAEYGRSEDKLTPCTPVNPEMGYGYAKLCAGNMTREYAHQLGMEHIWVRVLSVYGPNDGVNSMIMSTVKALRHNEKPSFTRGEQRWDYLFSRDAAEALFLLGERGTDGKVYVLGSGEARPLAEYIETLRDIVSPGAELGIGEVPYSPRQVMYLCADISEITRDTGWVPRTGFKEGITILNNELTERRRTWRLSLEEHALYADL